LLTRLPQLAERMHLTTIQLVTTDPQTIARCGLLLLGTVGLGLAAATDSKLIFLVGACAALALYWSYLPVVSVQIQRSAPEHARASAAGVLYSSMWLGAALGGLAAVAAPNWRFVVGGAALSWALAGIVAWRGFHPEPSAA
jgi:hypothetical protein